MIRSFQWDLARQVERLDWLLAQLPRYAEWGYHELHLHLEDAVEFPSLPGVARRDAYSYRQFGRLIDAASRAGIKVVPIVNLLGHTQYLIKVPALRDLNELRSSDGAPREHGQICPLHPRTLEVAEKLLRDMAPFCTAGKIHVGLDESFHIGRCPRCRAEIGRHGRAAHFARHVRRLNTLCTELGLKLGLWADMLYFLPDAIPLLPAGITAYEWYYHAFRRSPRVELFNFAEADIATPLRQRGIALYGCPMNGAFRFEPMPHFRDRLDNIVAWWRHAQRIGAEGFLVSSWESNRLALELTTAVDAAAASLWLEPELRDPEEMLARGFGRVFGQRGRAAARVALACDQYPFSGYPRWEINERWETISRRESVEPYQREAKFFTKLTRQCANKKLPAPLRDSVEFRSYLAARDVFVRGLNRLPAAPESGTPRKRADSAAFRATLRAGLRAAQTMWRLTRDSKVRGPNEKMILEDEARLRRWHRGEPVFGGRWQLCYRVWNFAPALHLVGVEQQQSDGSWEMLQSCHTIEFQTRAARRKSGIVREHAAPVRWNGDAQNFPRLRIVLRGIGQVKIGQVELGDGRLSWRVAGHRKILGRPAPRSGWPDLDWQRNADAMSCEFAT